MAKRTFSRAERWAVYQTHDSHCYICRKPISFTEMHIDHVVPEHLSDEPDALASVLHALGLSAEFSINDFGNWLPTCSPCNLAKASNPFEPAPIILIQLRRSRSLAEKARALAQKLQTDRALDAALVTIEIAADSEALDLKRLQPLLQIFLDRHPVAIQAMLKQIEQANHGLSLIVQEPVLELRLTPFASAIYMGGVVGITSPAARPPASDPDESEPCVRCGSLGPFSGIRCLNCGFMDPGD